MPRVSKTALALMDHVTSKVEVVRRVRVPNDLTEEQAIEFERIVGSMPADWFCPGHSILLSELAVHVVLTKRLNKRIERTMLRKGAPGDLDWLLRTKMGETKIISQLMSKLRLTPQAVQPKNVSSRRMHEAKNPWDLGEEPETDSD